MSASEHYLEAERLLDEEAKVYTKPLGDFADLVEIYQILDDRGTYQQALGDVKAAYGQRLRELAYVHALLAQAGFTLAHK
jgi:hypothetical protein